MSDQTIVARVLAQALRIGSTTAQHRCSGVIPIPIIKLACVKFSFQWVRIGLKSATIMESSPEGHIVVVYGGVVGIVLKSQIPRVMILELIIDWRIVISY